MKRRILFIDDDPCVLQGLRRALRLMHQEWDIAFAENGRQALELLADIPFDVIVTDVLMPEKDGLETIIALRQAFPTIKIIAMSGGGRKGNLCFLDIAKTLGASHTLHKPFGPQELLAVLREVLQSVGSDAPSGP